MKTRSRSTTAVSLAVAMLVALLATAFAASSAGATEPELGLQSANATQDALGTVQVEPKKQRRGRIVGGEATTIAEYPWQVGVAYNELIVPGNGFQRQFCGGTLVAPTIVVTAAHCIDQNSNGLFDEPASAFTSIMGRTTLSSTEGQEIGWNDYAFLGTAADPLWDPTTYDYDVIVAELSSAATAGTPIKIAGADEMPTWAPGRPAFLSGWGDTASGAGDYQDTLRAVRVATIADADCAAAYSGAAPFNPDTMFCAGAPGKDSCQGDSGGPNVVPLSGGEFRLAGDTSWGIGCADPSYPGVYARIAGGTSMGDVLQPGIQSLFGVDMYGSGGQPLQAPDTTITKAPKKKIKTKKKKVKVTFEFTNAEPTATMTCDLDGAVTTPCTSPFKAKVKKGKHTMTIGSTNSIGDVDATPATHKFKVKKKKKKK